VGADGLPPPPKGSAGLKLYHLLASGTLWPCHHLEFDLLGFRPGAKALARVVTWEDEALGPLIRGKKIAALGVAEPGDPASYPHGTSISNNPAQGRFTRRQKIIRGTTGSVPLMERLAGPVAWFLIKFYKIFPSCQTVSRKMLLVRRRQGEAVAPPVKDWRKCMGIEPT
jgi:hypothetical protein